MDSKGFFGELLQLLFKANACCSKCLQSCATVIQTKPVRGLIGLSYQTAYH